MSETPSHANSTPEPTSLRITETFTSLQGEGTRAGRLCTFVRLTGCDLRCRWCDTAYAFTGGSRRSIDAILAEVDRLGAPLVCVTGGEPLVQPGVHVLMRRLADAGYEVLLETGGHRDIGGVDPRVVRVLDLKAPGSGEVERNRWENLDLLTPRDEIKVVLADHGDYEWIREIIVERELASRATILLSPVHGELDPKELAEWVMADRLPVRVQLQLHKLIWGPEATGV